jgi:hypothetical protein
MCFLALIAGELWGQESPNYMPRQKRVRNGTAAVSSIGMMPPAYEQWWIDAKRCAKVHKGQIEDWSFYTVEGDGFSLEGSDDVFLGYTFADKRKIYLQLDRWLDRILVTHEMLHAILYENDREYGHHGRDDQEYSKADMLFLKCGLGAPPLRKV